MSNQGDSESLLKIVLCEEDDEPDIAGELEASTNTPTDKGDARPARMTIVRKPNGVRSANYVLTANPYQKRGIGCGNCQSIQNAKNNVGPFTQKIMSAKLLRSKQMQNQISEMSLQLNELIAENKTLKTLQKRQDNALKKYEGSKEQLPQLIKSHNEEVRVINMKFKQLKVAHKELENKLKQRDAELMNLREQHSHLLQLSRDKHLFERDKLTKKLAALELYSKEQNEKIVTLQRKLELQEKNFKHQLQIEIQKHRGTQYQLHIARQVPSTRAKEGKEKALSPQRKIDLHLDGFGHRSRVSHQSPARQPHVDSNRGLGSDLHTYGGHSNKDEDNDENESELRGVKVSMKVKEKTGADWRGSSRIPVKPEKDFAYKRNKPQSSSSSVPDSVDSKTSLRGIPGRISAPSNLSDDAPPDESTSDHQDDHKPLFGSPRLSQNYRGGISIPSDLTIGNAARMRMTAVETYSEESSESDEENSPAGNPDSKGSNETPLDSDAEFEMLENRLKSHPNSRARAEEDIDKIISKACDDMLASDLHHDAIMNGIEKFSLSEELSHLKELSWDELHKQIQPIKEEMTIKTESSLPSNDYLLDSKEKNHLLKALNMIDEENSSDVDTIIKEDNYSPPGEIEQVRHQSVRQMFAQNRKKVDLMKSLFGAESDPYPVPEGVN